MYRRLKGMVAAIGILIQIVSMLAYSFIETGVSGYTYMAIWIFSILLVKKSGLLCFEENVV